MGTQPLNCPACGAAVELRGGLPYCVCRYCSSLLARSDIALELVGRIALVPDDFSPLQLGSSGYFEGVRFTLIGRVRKRWEQGSWSEWLALFDDQRRGWLGEAQGDWMMMFPVGLEQVREAAPELEAVWRIEGAAYSVSDIRTARFAGAEGELPQKFSEDESVLSMDMRGPGMRVATAEKTASGLAVFDGRFVDFSECRFEHLRSLPGWDLRRQSP